MDVAIRLEDIHGTPGNPIVIDGSGVTVNGHGQAVPMRIKRCSWFVLRNWNLCNSSLSTLWITDCHDFTVDSVCAWNASSTGGDTNNSCIAVHQSSRGLFRDCAAWGTGRKTICASTNGDDLRWYRCFSRYDEPWNPDDDIHNGKNRMTWAIAYNNFRNVFVDCIGTVTTATPGRGHYVGIFAADWMTDDKPANTILTRCLAIADGLNVDGFQANNVNNISFDECVDATPGGLVSIDELRALRVAWSSSPMLGRIAQQSGFDISEKLSTLEPQPSDIR